MSLWDSDGDAGELHISPKKLKKHIFPGANVQGTIGCTPYSVPMVFIVFSRDSGGFLPIHTHYIGIYRAYIGISHRGTLVGVHPTIP